MQIVNEGIENLKEEVSLKYKQCDRFKNSNKRIHHFCKAITSHVQKNKDYYKKYINNLLDSHKENISDEEKKKYVDILTYVSDKRPEFKTRVSQFLSEMDSKSYIKENGSWHPINKLNTNYSDISEFITYMVDTYFKGNPSDKFIDIIVDKQKVYNQIKSYSGSNTYINNIKETYLKYNKLTNDHILSLGSNFDIFNDSKFIKDALENVLSKKVNVDIETIKTFTTNTIKNSYEGELIEGYVEQMLNDNGWKTIHRGGNGDFIDMKFGVDLIIEKNDEIKFVQVKKVWDIKYHESTIMRSIEDGGSFMVTGKVTDIREDIIDLVGLGTIDGKVIVSERQKEVVDRSNGDTQLFEYVDKKSFPVPKTGFCYVDHPFENIQNIKK